MAKTCESCRYFKYIDVLASGSGTCWSMPPVIVVLDGSVVHMRPFVDYPDSACSLYACYPTKARDNENK